MDLLDFFLQVFLPNSYIYFICLFLVGCLVYPIHRICVKSLLDPFFYQLWMSAFAYAVPPFLYFTGNISLNYFLFFVASNTAFWIGFLLIKRKEIKFSKVNISDSEAIAKCLFGFSLLMYLFSIVLTYSLFGIPLFYSNRNDVFKDAGGLGVIQRIYSFALTYVLLYSFYMLLEKGVSKYRWLIAFFVFNCILAGGKSAILGVVYCFFYYSYFYKGLVPKIKKRYLLFILLTPLLVLLLTISNGIGKAVVDLGFRFVANGDVYVIGYPNNIVERVRVPNPISHLLVGILGPLRLISYDDTSIATQPIGLLLNYEVNPGLAKLGITTAPNSRLDVISWIYYRWYGVCFSFIIGCLASFIIYWLPKFFPRNIFGIAFYSSFYFMGLCFMVDPGLSFSYMFDCIFNLVVYSFIFIISGLSVECYRMVKR